jgi:hypothetical protein
VTWLPEKKISFFPSLLKSPIPTPPPIYPNSLIKEWEESFSRISLLKCIPDSAALSWVNKGIVVLWLQETNKNKTPLKKNEKQNKNLSFIENTS